MPSFSYRVIGEWSVQSSDGTRLRVSGKQRLILAALLIAGRPLSDGELLMVGWGRDAGPSRKPSLHTHMSGLRSLLGSNVLPAVEDGRYRIAVDAEDVDVHTFRRYVTEGVVAERAARTADAVAAYDAALEIWPRSASLAVDVSSVLPGEVEELHRLRSRAAEQLAELQVGLGSFDEATGHLEAIVLADPGNERAWSLLARAEWRGHGREAGLRTIRRAREILIEEFGHDLPLAMQRLELEILSGEATPAVAPPTPAIPTGEAATRGDPARTAHAYVSMLPVTDQVLTGRDAVLRQIKDLWQSDSCNVVQVVAWAGVGKTSIVNELVRHALGHDTPRMYAWSFSDQGTTGPTTSSDLFVQEALAWFGDENPTAGESWSRGLRLARLIRLSRTLLVLDGLRGTPEPARPRRGAACGNRR
jgi:DNA-binding SARP family transcriptional activator